MDISIVIPVYNNKTLLKNTLKALNNQKNLKKHKFEVIIVDDGSQENTYDYIKGINRKYELKYIYLERCSDSSRARTRNYGWRNATGKLIAFIDGDILVKDTYLDELSRCFSLNKNAVIIGTYLMLSENVSYQSICDKSVFEKYTFNWDNTEMLEFRYRVFNNSSYNINTLFYPWLLVFSGNMAVSKLWLEKVNGFDENFKHWGVEDVELGYRLFKEGLKIIVNSKLEVLHQFHGKNGDSIDCNRYQGIDMNTKYFLTKHPDALKMPENMVHDMFKGKLDIDFRKNNDKLIEEIVIEFKNKEFINDVKKTIVSLLNQHDLRIIVYDYVEKTDLDIWIQLLKADDIEIMYFPMSYKAEVVSFDYIYNNGISSNSFVFD